MRLVVSLLGVEVFSICTDSDSPSPDSVEPGDATSTASSWVGFTPGVRWDADVVEP